MYLIINDFGWGGVLLFSFYGVWRSFLLWLEISSNGGMGFGLGIRRYESFPAWPQLAVWPAWASKGRTGQMDMKHWTPVCCLLNAVIVGFPYSAIAFYTEASSASICKVKITCIKIITWQYFQKTAHWRLSPINPEQPVLSCSTETDLWLSSGVPAEAAGLHLGTMLYGKYIFKY